MQIHLRTPPAPTFAPLVFSILSLSAQIYSTCLESIWKEVEKSPSISHIYSTFVSSHDTEQQNKSSSLVLDAHNLHDRGPWEKMLTKIQCSDRRGDLGWLPMALIQSDRPERLDQRVDPSTTPFLKIQDNFSTSAIIRSNLSNDQDEDIGETL